MAKSDWFFELTGFPEETPQQVRSLLELEGSQLRSKVSGRVVECGQLSLPSLAELRQQVGDLGLKPTGEGLQFSELVANVRDLIADLGLAGSLFQVASQFNLLEMTYPSVTPEAGVTRYQDDPTQGPACATAVGGATLYRNYFVPLGGQVGQSEDLQLDCMQDFAAELSPHPLWRMQNGYLMASAKQLAELKGRLAGVSEAEKEWLKGHIRIGWVQNAEVTLAGSGHRVSQAFCSALPISYQAHPLEAWEPFAQWVLEAAYEATLHTGLLNYANTGNPRVYLTMLGGGAFGNPRSWIVAALRQALYRAREWPLEVYLVSYGYPQKELQLLGDWR